MINKIYSSLAALIIISLITFTACGNKTEANKTEATAETAHKEGEKHAEGEHKEGEEAAAEGIKEVLLNEAQYTATGLVLGGFEKKNLSEVINANGYTKLPPQNQAQVSVPLSGTIKTIKVIEGQYVKQGQILATVQSMAYNNLRLEREKLMQDLQQSEGSLPYLRLEYARQKELSDENVNAKKVFQKVSSDVNLEEMKIRGLQNQIAILSQNIEIGGNSTSPIINITAPITGHITEVNINIGSAVDVGKPLFVIVDNAKMHVDLLVYEKDLFKVKAGQTVRFILTNQNAAEYKGEIFNIGQSFTNETKTIAVHADIDNEKHTLISGMYVNALIDVGSNAVFALPQEAVIKAEGREFIFVFEGEKKENDKKEFHFQRIEVKTGASQLGFVGITPLQPIDGAKKNIVVKGAFYLQSHLQVSEAGGGGHDH
jgi:membrane fusion protein, heavy metal efflux system